MQKTIQSGMQAAGMQKDRERSNWERSRSDVKQ